MKFTGDSLRNYRICNKHFTRDMYVDYVRCKLSRAAVPFAWIEQPSTSCSTSQVEVFHNPEQSISLDGEGDS